MGLYRLLGVGLAVLPLSTVHAALIVLDQPVTPVATVISTAYQPASQLSQVRYDSLVENSYPRILFGSPAKDVYMPKLQGQGRGVNLTLALSQIIPNDFKVVSSPELVAQNRKVNWKSSAHWISTFHDLLAKENLTAMLDLGMKTANVYPMGTNSAKTKTSNQGYNKLAINRAVNGSANVALGPTAGTSPNVAPSVKVAAPIAVIMPVWGVEKGQTLRSVLESWALKERWNIAWDANIDYPIESPFALNGDFLSAVEKMVGLYEKADRPLYASAYSSQKLIVITDKKGKP